MGVAQHERDRLDPKVLQGLDSVRAIEENRRREDSLNYLLKKTGTADVALTANTVKSLARLLSNTNNRGSLGSLAGDAIGGAATAVTLPMAFNRSAKEVDEALKQKQYLKQTRQSGGGFGMAASNLAGTAQKATAGMAGLYGAGYLSTGAAAAAKAAGYGGLAGNLSAGGEMLKAGGSWAFKHNPITPTSWMHQAGGFQQLAPAMVNKGAGAFNYMGNVASGLGYKSAGGMMGSTGGALNSFASALEHVDPMIAQTASLLAMMGGGLMANKFLGKMRSLNPVSRAMKSGKNISMNIQAGSTIREKYSEARVLDTQLNMYSSMGALSAGETLTISYLGIIARNSGLLQYLVEHFQTQSEGGRVGSSLKHNETVGRYNRSIRDDDYTTLHSTDEYARMDFGGKLGYGINKGLDHLNTAVTAASTVLNPLAYLSIKNNPVALLKKLYGDNLENKAISKTAERLNIPQNFMIAMETTATKAMDANSPDLQQVGLLAWIGENVRHMTHMMATKHTGKDTIGAVGNELDRLEDNRNGFANTMENLLGMIPGLNVLATATYGMRSIGSGIAGLAGSLFNNSDSSISKFGIADSQNPEFLMYKYMGTVFPNKFEALLTAQKDSNRFVVTIASQMGVPKNKLRKTGSREQWVEEFGEMMQRKDIIERFWKAKQSKESEMLGDSKKGILSTLFGLTSEHDIKKLNVRDTANKGFVGALSKYLKGSKNNNADASQQLIVKEREHDEEIARSKTIAGRMVSMDETLKKLLGKEDPSNPNSEESGGLLGWLGAGLGQGVKKFAGGLKKLAGLALTGGMFLGGKVLGKFPKTKAGLKWAFEGASKIAKVFKPFALISGALGLFLYQDEIFGWVKEKAGNLVNGDFSKMFGFGKKDSEGQTAFQTSKDVSKALFTVASTAAMMFPNPVTLGLAAVTGLYAYQDDIFGFGRKALDKLTGGWFSDFFEIDTMNDTTMRDKRAKEIADEKAAEEAAKRKMMDQVAIENRMKNAIYSKDSINKNYFKKYQSMKLGTSGDFLSAEFLKAHADMVGKDFTAQDLINYKHENMTKRGREMAENLSELSQKYGGDNGLIDTEAEFQKMYQEMEKDRNMWQSMQADQVNVLTQALSTLIDSVNEGNSIKKMEAVKDKWNSLVKIESKQQAQ